MITFVQGNLFESPAQVLCNTVNCVGVMGKGIALEFKQRYPAMYEDYKLRCKVGNVRLGEAYLWEDDRVQILNFPTKGHWKENSRLEDIDAGLRFLHGHYQEMGIYSLAMPPLGCGNGGLNWRDVRLLIDQRLGDVPDLEVYVYEPVAISGGEIATNGSLGDSNSPSGVKHSAQPRDEAKINSGISQISRP